MAYLTISDTEGALQRTQARRQIAKAATVVLKESASAFRSTDSFDVFLSHCLKDADKVLGVKAYLEEQHLKVYVDWIEDPQLDRGKVTPATADHLRTRMAACASMIFATSDNSPDSKWMPWELGFFDGLRKGRIAILPLIASEGATFDGQQYLGLYPKIEKLPLTTGGFQVFVTNGVGTKTYISLKDFRDGVTQFKSY